MNEKRKLKIAVYDLVSSTKEYYGTEAKTHQLVDKYTYYLMKYSNYWPRKGWYITGNLEKMVGYDLGEILNYGELDLIKSDPKDEKAFYIKGVYEVDVVGVEEDCMGYFWIDEMKNQRGLVFLKSDTISSEYARKKYSERSNTL